MQSGRQARKHAAAGKVLSPCREIHFPKQSKSMQHLKTQIGVCQREQVGMGPGVNKGE